MDMEKEQEKSSKGKFIVFYGPNNCGKSSQAKLLVENLELNGYKAKHIKYPVYDLKPSGHIINDYLRKNNPYNLSPREAQIVYALNRQHFEPELRRLLEKGVHVVAECYIGTGLAWGEASGVDPLFLRHINSHLLPEDLAFSFEGEQFAKAIEKNHRHETNLDLMHEVRGIFSRLSDDLSWIKIDSSRSVQEIEKQIFEYVIEYIRNIDSPHSFPNFVHWHKNFARAKDKKAQEKVKVVRLSPLAKLPRGKNGYVYNLFAHDFFSVRPGENVAIGTGIKISLPENIIALVKSELGHFSFVIDSSYEKELKIMWFNSTDDIYHIAPGQKIGQLMFQRLTKPRLRSK